MVFCAVYPGKGMAVSESMNSGREEAFCKNVAGAEFWIL